MTPQELKEYFNSNPPPFEVDWKPWAKIINSKQFIEACCTAISSYKGSYQQCPDYWHLLDFYRYTIGNTPDNK